MTFSIVEQKSSSTPKTLMLCFHGLGAPKDDMAFFHKIRSTTTPDLLTVCIAAPHQPVSLYSNSVMPSWFEIESLSCVTSKMQESLESTVANLSIFLHEFLLRYPTLVNVSTLGFSQGGVVALALSDYFPIHDVVLLSTFYFPEKNIKTLPQHIFLSHGFDDGVVSIELGRVLAERLGKDAKTFYGHWEHSIPPQVVAALINFWGKIQ